VPRGNPSSPAGGINYFCKYDAGDLEDRYETRLRAMIDAKLKGEGIAEDEVVEPDRTNVVDLMAALKKSRMTAALRWVTSVKLV
jgi:non-homologous end joining protein Ku